MSLPESLQTALEGKIDFQGQKLAESISRSVLFTTTIIAFLAGVITQSLKTTFSIFTVATVVLVLLVVPPWPLFNRHPVKWLPTPGDSKKKSQ